MKKILLTIFTITLFGCVEYTNKSVRLDNIKSKGVIISKDNYKGLTIVIKTDSTIVIETITQEEFNYLHTLDTIK